MKALAMLLALVFTQNPFGDLAKPAEKSKPAAVSYLFPEQVTVVAGKSSPIDLHFKVADGLHINSHTPSEEGLIPTTLRLPEVSGVKLGKASFPAGKDFTLKAGSGPGEKLSVYTGEFIVRAEVVAGKGEHLVEGSLRYQACDNSQCMPPHTIPVVLDVIAR